MFVILLFIRCLRIAGLAVWELSVATLTKDFQETMKNREQSPLLCQLPAEYFKNQEGHACFFKEGLLA